LFFPPELVRFVPEALGAAHNGRQVVVADLGDQLGVGLDVRLRLKTVNVRGGAGKKDVLPDVGFPFFEVPNVVAGAGERTERALSVVDGVGDLVFLEGIIVEPFGRSERLADVSEGDFGVLFLILLEERSVKVALNDAVEPPFLPLAVGEDNVWFGQTSVLLAGLLHRPPRLF